MELYVPSQRMPVALSCPETLYGRRDTPTVRFKSLESLLHNFLHSHVSLRCERYARDELTKLLSDGITVAFGVCERFACATAIATCFDQVSWRHAARLDFA